MKNKTFYLYKTVNKVNGKFYIGVRGHKNPLKDRYLGSGRWLKEAIKKYGRDNFHKEILIIEDNMEKIFYVESLVVDEELVNDPNCYNLVPGGGTVSLPRDKNPMFNRKHTEETKQRMSLNHHNVKGANNPMYGKKGEDNPNYGKLIGDKNPMYGKKGVESVSFRGFWITPTGSYPTMEAAAKGNNISIPTLHKRCKNPNIIVKPHYLIPTEYWGKTWRDNGYFFTEKTQD